MICPLTTVKNAASLSKFRFYENSTSNNFIYISVGRIDRSRLCNNFNINRKPKNIYFNRYYLYNRMGNYYEEYEIGARNKKHLALI